MIDLRTALIIQNNEVRCEAGGPDPETKKFVGWIMRDVERWEPLLNTQPIFETADEARKAMNDLVIAIRGIDLSKAIDNLSSMLEGKGQR
jgi:hypothetical protein